MTTVHWLGAGLSSAPGIRMLAAGGRELLLWNRTLEKAQAIVAPLSPQAAARSLDFEQLARVAAPGDILVSMLPGDLHERVARIALTNEAHFVSSSYIAPSMAQLHGQALARGLCLVNEVGLDPGIDHLLAHSLVAAYRESDCHQPDCALHFRSYCGGFPKTPNDFRYKFSWSPLGVLRALGTPARCIAAGRELKIDKPWQAISEYRARLPAGEEAFEAYPNRDSLPFLSQYGFDDGWTVEQFVRGTLRPAGWSRAWAGLFQEIDTLGGAGAEARLRALSDELWRDYQYQPGEPDRVVLCVELESRQADRAVWHQGYALDASGNASGSAMARLVSLTVALAVDSVSAGEIAAGVSAAPDDPELVQRWLRKLRELGEPLTTREDYLDPAQGG